MQEACEIRTMAALSSAQRATVEIILFSAMSLGTVMAEALRVLRLTKRNKPHLY